MLTGRGEGYIVSIARDMGIIMGMTDHERSDLLVNLKLIAAGGHGRIPVHGQILCPVVAVDLHPRRVIVTRGLHPGHRGGLPNFSLERGFPTILLV